MAEGVAVAGGPVLSAAVHDDPDSAPPPSAEAPRGWTWNRETRGWKPKIRGRILYQDDGAPAAGDAPAGDEPQQQQRDPAPAWARQDAKPEKQQARQLRFEDVPQEVKDDAAGLIGLVGAPILGMLQSLDPFCGAALASCFEPAVDAALPLILRSSKIVRYFQDDSNDWLMWGKLAMALAPAGQAILQHHVFRTVEVVRDEHGGAYVQARQPRDGAPDPLQPQPQPEPSYNYAA